LLLLLGLKSLVVSWYMATACASPLLPLFVPNADENSFLSVRIIQISLAESLMM
jgi:hypothetical protein